MTLPDMPVNPDGPLSRRQMLSRCGMGFGALALADLVGPPGTQNTQSTQAASAVALNPLAPKPAHFPARAKRVIHIFANGGPSHVDSFDPKPALEKYAGKPIPSGNLTTERRTGAAYPSPFPFRKYGQSGIPVSDLFPHVAQSIDDICVIRSMKTDLPNHEPSLLMMNCGDNRQSRPSMGAWITYGLGSLNQNLPSFVVLCPGGYPIQESQNWQSAFLPGIYQGTFIDSKHRDIAKLIEHIRNAHTSKKNQRRQLDLLKALNEDHQASRPREALLEARIQSFELAYRMQTEAAEAFDVASEPKHIHQMYGSGIQARQLLMARRLLERGVRIVQVWAGASQPWDNHDKIKQNHGKLAKEIDQPLGALLKDLKQRGMLDDTLVIWGGEFGRTPSVELPQGSGRDHNPYGFSMWMAGGGVKGGHVHGATDEFGFKAVDKVVHVHDLHATIMHLLGFDHEKFTYRYAGRDFRLTDVHGKVVTEILA